MRLVAMTGPLAGRTFDLSAEETSVGRANVNDLVVPDDLVSKTHCVISTSGDTCSVRDAGSQNQTYVNGHAAPEQSLRTGDQLRIGRSVFAVAIGSPTGASRLEMYFDDGDDTRYETRSLPVADFLRVRDLSEARGAKDLRDLETLLAISQSLSQFETFEALRARLLDLILDAIPADAGAILIEPYGSGSELDFASVFIRQGSRPTGQAFRCSGTIVHQVLDKREGILVNSVSTDLRFSDAESLRASHVESVLSVPIPEGRGIVGIIYLMSEEPASFGQRDLELLAGIAGIIAAPLENLRRLEWFEGEARRRETEDIAHNILGESEAIAHVRSQIGKVADTTATVLILGETGVGKELVARAIHQSSPRASAPFVDINCASLKQELIEADLFGSEPGGFTGALRRKGKLEVANGGTLFLDEVGELEPRAQSALLRVIETGQFQRVGGAATITVDVRVVAATNVDLSEAAREGRFREDLLHRLNVFRLDVPPLRQRREDILPLAGYFLQKAASRHKRPVLDLTPEARHCVLHFDWPGNVRQLENAMEYAVISAVSGAVGVESLPADVLTGDPAVEDGIPKLYAAVNEATRTIIRDTLRATSGKVAASAAMLGIHPNNLHRLIARHNLKEDLDEIRAKGT